MKLSTLSFFGLAAILSTNGVLAKQHSSSLTLDKALLTRKQNSRAKAFLPREHVNKISKNPIETVPRGGACSDTNPVLFLKIGTTTLTESAALFGIIFASLRGYPEWVPEVFNQPLLSLLACMFVVFGSSFVGALVEGGMSVATQQVLEPNKVLGDPNWYANLEKPSWNPPGWVFPIMWLIVSKPTQLCALSRLIKFGVESDKAASLQALALYCVHLGLGNAWNKVFFDLQCIKRGCFVITLFYAALLGSAYLFYNIDKGAGYYLLPTCGWVTVATALQYSIYFNNKDK